MPAYVVDPPATNAAPVKGSDLLFPVRRVYCIGRNYAAHAIEMGHDPNREPPFFFQKNPDNIDFSGTFPYPSKTKDVHHAIELVVALSKGGTNIPIDKALGHVWGYAVGLDMTRRDLQGIKGHEPPVGNRQGVRTLGADGPDRAGRGDRASVVGQDRAQGQRQGQKSGGNADSSAFPRVNDRRAR
jgi:2-keto-4-pentenoate hydratase/2-oxohepta-3-ene-1,7-dioic acid hydratase in catechol pathway